MNKASRAWLGAAFATLAAGLCVAGLLGRGASMGAATAATLPRLCTNYSGLPDGFGVQARAGMVRVPAGTVRLGSAQGYAEEKPTGESLRIDAFWIDRTEVTNAQFSAFTRATGYVTEAEREGAAAVFQVPRAGHGVLREGEWWEWRQGANWRRPQGSSSKATAQPNEPVVLVTYADALAYARWLGRDLPSEAEWEYAAQGGGSAEQIDREPRDAQGHPTANYWQGMFPDLNTTEDGYAALSPVGCFDANGYGLFDVIGNVWELTRDRYSGAHQPHGNGDPTLSIREAGGTPRRGEQRVIKGGSFLCARSYCLRYRTTARQPQEADMSTSHVGFRTVLRGTAGS